MKWDVFTCFLTIVFQTIFVSTAAAEMPIDVAVEDVDGCVLFDDGKVWCWGEDIAPVPPAGVPVFPLRAFQVPGIEDAIAIDVGRATACAVLEDRSVRCWGASLQDAESDGSLTKSLEPLLVSALPPVQRVSIGFVHACALSVEGEVWCWGYNPIGELGTGRKQTDWVLQMPRRVAGIDDAVAVSAGVNNSCAVRRNGQVLCWGSYNPGGVQSWESMVESSEPVLIPASQLVDVASGRNFGCGLRQSGEVACWGSNVLSQLGAKSLYFDEGFQGAGIVNGVREASDLDVHYFHACAVDSGDVYCWGASDMQGTKLGGRKPSKFEGVTGATKVATGEYMNCAIDRGIVKCWGYTGGDFEIFPGMSPEKAVSVPSLRSEFDVWKVLDEADLNRFVEEGELFVAVNLADRLINQTDESSTLNEAAARAYYAYARSLGERTKDAFPWLLKSAEMGNVLAQTSLGYNYRYGKGTQPDYFQALTWLGKAAKQGNAKAQTQLGIMYQFGKGVPVDLAASYHLYRQAADQGYARAQANVGYAYEAGKGVDKDPEKAAEWYRLSAEQGYARGQQNLADLYRRGVGVEKDYAEALKWYRLASDQGRSTAEFYVGVFYDFSKGVIENDEEAMKWYRRAAAKDHPGSQNNLAWLLFLSGSYEEGLEMVDRSLANRPDHVSTLHTKAHLLAALDRGDEALTVIENAVRLGGNEFVGELQEWLIERGYPVDIVYGIYGKRTRASLIACIKEGCYLKH